jgi:hypothetical protein
MEGNTTLFALPSTFTVFSLTIAHNTHLFVAFFFFSVAGVCIGKWAQFLARNLSSVVLDARRPQMLYAGSSTVSNSLLAMSTRKSVYGFFLFVIL